MKYTPRTTDCFKEGITSSRATRTPMNLSAVLTYVIFITVPCHAEDLRPDGIRVNDIVSDFRRSLPESERGRIDSIGLSDQLVIIGGGSTVENGKLRINTIDNIALTGLIKLRATITVLGKDVTDNRDKVLVGMSRLNKVSDDSVTCDANVIIYHKSGESEIMLLIPFTFKYQKLINTNNYSDLKVLSEDAIMVAK
jgi:hypothetical protein